MQAETNVVSDCAREDERILLYVSHLTVNLVIARLFHCLIHNRLQEASLTRADLTDDSEQILRHQLH